MSIVANLSPPETRTTTTTATTVQSNFMELGGTTDAISHILTVTTTMTVTEWGSTGIHGQAWTIHCLS